MTRAALAARAPADPAQEAAEESRKKAKRDKDIKKAMEEGEKRAKKEIEEMGGPDPYSGYFVPHMMSSSEKAMLDMFEKYKKDNPKEPRTTAISKKWKEAMQEIMGESEQGETEEEHEEEGEGGKEKQPEEVRP